MEQSPKESQDMTAIAFNPKALAPAWNTFQRALPVRLAAIHNQADYERGG